MNYDDLVRAKLELDMAQAKYDALCGQAIKHMQATGANELSTSNASLSLKQKGTRLLPANSAAVAELKEAIELERQEMLDANASRIYALTRQRDLCQHQIDLLLTNEWIEELNRKLEAAKQDKADTTATYNKLTIKLSDNVRDYVDSITYNEHLARCKQLDPPLTKANLNKCILNWGRGLLPEHGSLSDAVDARIAEHIAYHKTA